jgi:uncharacterized membrane protein
MPSDRLTASRRLLLSLAIAVPWVTAMAAPAAAADRVEISTPYPAVAVEPGATAEFPLKVLADTKERVSLTADGVPEGWTATFRGGGFVVDGVFADPAEPPEVSLNVEVPADAAEGTYRITISARAGAAATLPLDLRVNAAAAGSLEMTSQFPQLQGPSSATFDFDLTLQNDTPEEIQANFSSEGPEGWQIEVRPSGQEQAASATVDAGGSTGLTVSVDPAEEVVAGEYPIVVRATSGTRTVETELQVTITGQFSMTLSTADDRLNAQATAGQPRQLQLTVRNDGTAPLVGITLSGTPPADWPEVTFSPATIDQLAPNEEANVTATITAASDAVAGDYVVSFEATTAEASANADIRTTVETSLTWGIIGVLLIVATLLGLGWVFRTYGRR